VQTIINDPYPGMIYKDPIVILINEFGFSKRVLLLHCKTTIELMGTGTLGKATIQSIMALEKMMIKFCENKY
jgi:carboxyl-terminal processing protease